jgi:hypothetical protein
VGRERLKGGKLVCYSSLGREARIPHPPPSPSVKTVFNNNTKILLLPHCYPWKADRQRVAENRAPGGRRGRGVRKWREEEEGRSEFVEEKKRVAFVFGKGKEWSVYVFR